MATFISLLKPVYSRWIQCKWLYILLEQVCRLTDSIPLLSVIFGYIVCQPVHFGFPALSQGFIKLESEVFQCLFIRFTKSQGILRVRGRIQYSLT